MKLVVAFIFLMPCFHPAFAQEKKPLDVICDEIKIEAKKERLFGLYKAAHYSTTESWDSVMLYTAHNQTTLRETKHISQNRFLRAMAMRYKRLYKKAGEELAKIPSNVSFYNYVLIRKGDLAFMQGGYKKGLYYYKLVDTINPAKLHYISRFDHYVDLGRAFFYLKNFKDAEKYMLLAERLLTSNKALKDVTNYYTDFANLYYEQYQDSIAMKYFRKAYAIAERSSDLESKVLCTCNLAQVYLNGEDFERAARFFERCKELKDEKFDQDKIWETGEREKQLMLKIKQKEISDLANENRIKNLERNVFIIVAIFLLVFLLMGLYQYRLNQKRAKVIFEQKEALNELNATKDQLFSIIGHDLRSSVNALRSGSHALENSLEINDMDKAREQLKQNSVIATNTYNLLDNLLQWSLLQTKGGYFSPEEHRLTMLIEQVAYNYKGVLDQRQIQFKNDIPRSARVWVDAESLKLVLRNLMDNSIKFSKDKGRIMITIHNDTPDSITFAWEDNGAGMSPETKDKLLKSKRLDRKEHEQTIGAGLGMQLVASMIARNGGELDILSELGKGTKMLVTLRKKKHGETEDTRG